MTVKNIMLARQPIFDLKQNIYAYELLYRGNTSDEVNDNSMTATVLSYALNCFGIDEVTNGKLIFINVSTHFIISEFPKILPIDKTVLEIKENVLINDELIRSVQHWRNQGFMIALDNFTQANFLLLPYVDMVKVDIQGYPNKLDELIQKLRSYPIKLLAEKVESTEQYERCKQLGFDYFQGYFFCKPSLMKNSNALDTSKTQLLHLLSQVLAAESPKELEYDIAHDLTLSYKILRYINSVSVGLKTKVNSISHALTLMGLDKLRIWISMLLLASLSKNKPDALLVLSFCRARFLEQLAISQNNQQQGNDYFILGMFSLLDALLDQNIDDLLKSMSLPILVSQGLSDPSSSPAIRLNLILALEKGEWNHIEKLLHTEVLDTHDITSIYTEAIQWADEKISFLKRV